MDAQTIVVGGGTCGAAIAGRLAESGFDVLLLEAGPDYGPVNSGRWPAELLDPSTMPVDSHSWGYANAAIDSRDGVDLERARVIGGCSSHNGCAVVWGHEQDYDRWQAMGNPGWDADGMRPYLERASARLQVTTPRLEEITPFHQAMLSAAPVAGFPILSDLAQIDIGEGFGIGPINVVNRTRWNTGFAYLDPVRGLPNLSILADTMVDRVVLRGHKVTGVVTAYDETITCERVVVASGAYGSPLILQRSGIGDPSDLLTAGVALQHLLPGVGRNLQDHPAVTFHFSGSPELVRQLEQFTVEGGLPREEGTIGFANSRRSDRAFDLHIYPSARRDGPGLWSISIWAAVMASRSRGLIRLTSADPEAAPHIDHGYLTDDTGYDCDALVDGVAIIRRLAATEPLFGLIGEEIGSTAGLEGDDLRLSILYDCRHDYHPTSTCKMGIASDPMAVVNQAGKVHGLDGLYVGDASIMPAVPVANTNLPALAVAEKIAAGLQMIART